MERVCQMCQTLMYDDELTNCTNCGADLQSMETEEEPETTSARDDDLAEDASERDGNLAEEPPEEMDEAAIDAELGLDDDDSEEVEEPQPVEVSEGDEDQAEEVVEGEWDTGSVGAGTGMDEFEEGDEEPSEEDDAIDDDDGGPDEEDAEIDETLETGEPSEASVSDDDLAEETSERDDNLAEETSESNGDLAEEASERDDNLAEEASGTDDVPEEAAEEVEEVELAADEMLCPSCNDVMKSASAICPNCSFDTEHLHACPSCGVGIDKIADICPHCYTDLTMLEEQTAKPEEAVSEEAVPEGEGPAVGSVDGETAEVAAEDDEPDDKAAEKEKAKADKEFKKNVKAVMKIEKALQKDLKKGKMTPEEFEIKLNEARVEHGLDTIDVEQEPELINGNGRVNGNRRVDGKVNGKRLRKRMEKDELDRIVREEMEKEEFFSYYTLSLFTLFFFIFTAVFVIMEFFLTVTNITNDSGIPMVTFSLVPTFGFIGGKSILLFAVVITVSDAILHLWDKKINLWLSLIPSGIMAMGLALDITYPQEFIGGNLIWVILMLIILILMIVIDLFCLLFKYPAVLESNQRNEFDLFLNKEDEIHEIQQKLEEEYQQMIEEEEEKLKVKDEEIHSIKTELESLGDQIQLEEEKLRMKEEEVSAIKAELELKTQEITEEEEKLRMKEDEMESIIQTELEKRKDDLLMEEEENLRMKEEELVSTRNELEIQKNLMDDTREKLRLKEQEMMSLRTELENQMRHRMEEEDRLKLKEAAARMLDRGKQKRVLFPFTAMVGQEKMKRALILNAIYPEIGGVLIRGQKGTGKSVSVRGLAEILPDIEVPGCKFNCDPKDADNFCTECRAAFDAGNLKVSERQVQVVDLPLNVTEDRLVGSIDIEKVLTEGVKSFEPGILAEAHRGVLYVDEINLLDDYIVDILLDAASSGVVTIEREGISLSHPSRFIIVGSMNPEEGELRPQILDRIALQTDVVGIQDVDKRIDIVKRREGFTADPLEFREKYEPSRLELVDKITRAKDMLPKVTTPPRIYKLIAQVCLDFNVDGHRADIIIERAARANAAFEGRTETNIDDVIAGSAMALPHRMRRRIYEEEEEFSEEMLRKLIEKRDADME